MDNYGLSLCLRKKKIRETFHSPCPYRFVSHYLIFSNTECNMTTEGPYRTEPDQESFYILQLYSGGSSDLIHMYNPHFGVSSTESGSPSPAYIR